MMKCVIDGRARMEKRTRKESKWKQRTRRDRSLRSGVVLFTDGAAQSGAENCRGATDTVHCCVCDATTSSPNLEFSETVEDDLQNAVQRWCGQCPCRDAEAFSHQSWFSLPESFVKSHVACGGKIVVCELRFGHKPRSMSSHLHYLLFSCIFCDIFSEKKSRSRFFTKSLHFL